MKYRLTGPAKQDLREIWQYLAEHASLDIADRVISEIHRAVLEIGERPEIGHLRTDLIEEPLRFWRVHSYLVVYLPDSTPLVVLRILHGARDVRALLEEDPETGTPLP